MNWLHPPEDPLLKYVSRSSPVSGSKNASQCNVPHPVCNVRFLPTQLSSALIIIPLLRVVLGFSDVSSSFLLSDVVRIPARLHPSRKIVTPLSPASQAVIYNPSTCSTAKSFGTLTVELIDASICVCQTLCI